MIKSFIPSNLFYVFNEDQDSKEIFCFDCLDEDNKIEITKEDSIEIEVVNARNISLNAATKNDFECSICNCEPSERNNNSENEENITIDFKIDEDQEDNNNKKKRGKKTEDKIKIEIPKALLLEEIENLDLDDNNDEEEKQKEIEKLQKQLKSELSQKKSMAKEIKIKVNLIEIPVGNGIKIVNPNTVNLMPKRSAKSMWDL